MKEYQYYLLDWDGNLAKTLHVWIEAFHVVLAKRGIEASDKEIVATFGKKTSFTDGWDIKDNDEAYQEADEYVKVKLPHVELYPDAIEVLNALHDKGKKLALVTSSRHEIVIGLLDSYNLRRLFDVVVAGDDVTHHKPHAEPLEKALVALGGTKDQAVMIGDSDKDLGAAQNFGIDSILFYPDEHAAFYDLDDLKPFNPTYIIEDFKKILRFS